MLDDVRAIDASPLRTRIREAYLADEAASVQSLIDRADLSGEVRRAISARARQLVEHIRGAGRDRSRIESFLSEYGLTNDEGVALMCLAEAMLRVPDTFTLDALIQDKIGPADWQRHLGHSESTFVNASSWGLMLAGRIVREDEAVMRGRIRAVVRKLGAPVIRTAVAKSMELLGEAFVLGRTIDEALAKAAPMEAAGYRFSYDMLGEAALTEPDAENYFRAYRQAIAAIAGRCVHRGVVDNPGISVKLSALHPRYEMAKRHRVLDELVGPLMALAVAAKHANMGFNVDAEEADRLELSLDVIAALSANPELKGWAGLGVVVQAYQKRAPYVLDWLADLARRHRRRFMVRLVKGAYWDSEIKRHQELGLAGYPVFTRKASTDIAFLACAKQLLASRGVFYPQFATHNAHTVAAVLELAGDFRGYEFQRLHGMGEVLHGWIVTQAKITTRVYAPVGVHKDLLAYLVRRLLENGANSSFVNQIVDHSVAIEALVADPVDEVLAQAEIPHQKIPLPVDLYRPTRPNSTGLNLADPLVLARLQAALRPFARKTWSACPLIGDTQRQGEATEVTNPADRADVVGTVVEADVDQVGVALERALAAAPRWSAEPVEARGEILRRTADLYERNAAELIALCVREAGKTYADAVAEVREAVDFLRFYPVEAAALAARTARQPLGVFVCISPWNFPLAIFAGQIAAALAAGNPVAAKPAEQTPLIAQLAASLFHQAGVADDVLQLLPGPGETIGAALASDPRVAGVAFTGSTAVARSIRQAMVRAGNERAALVAETGGLNAMIVDSTALPEQAVKDVLASAFQSAGQRCSALRLLYLQEDVADAILDMLAGAMAELSVGDPALLSTDIGPVIDEAARAKIADHVDRLKREARLIHECKPAAGAASGSFIQPVAFELDRPEQLTEEIFGPVLHVVRFPAAGLEAAVESINASGFGLTLGIHSRVDQTVDRVTGHARVGNIYVNRNQIGAVVGVQPFGGEGLSGTGPKAGGPNYLLAFTGSGLTAVVTPKAPEASCPVAIALSDLAGEVRSLQPAWDRRHDRDEVLAQAAEEFAAMDTAGELALAIAEAAAWARARCREPLALPGPTGEQNQMALYGRGVFLCLGDQTGARAAVVRQTAWALAAGNGVVAPLAEADKRCFVAAGVPAALLQCLPVDFSPLGLAARDLEAFDGMAIEGPGPAVRAVAEAAAACAGPIIPVIATPDRYFSFATERTLSIDTTASGGNATLLAMVS